MVYTDDSPDVLTVSFTKGKKRQKKYQKFHSPFFRIDRIKAKTHIA